MHKLCDVRRKEWNKVSQNVTEKFSWKLQHGNLLLSPTTETNTKRLYMYTYIYTYMYTLYMHNLFEPIVMP